MAWRIGECLAIGRRHGVGDRFENLAGPGERATAKISAANGSICLRRADEAC